MKIDEKVIAVIHRADDLELHVKTIHLDHDGGIDLVSIREYVVSDNRYARGVTFPASDAPALVKALRGVKN